MSFCSLYITERYHPTLIVYQHAQNAHMRITSVGLLAQDLGIATIKCQT